MKQIDVAVVGGGIIGLAHAWSAARSGRSVMLFERHERALGASIRNFGMIWPIGQPPGIGEELAAVGRARWLEAARAAGFWLNECGSLHLAYRDDEVAVLEEYCRLCDRDYQLLSKKEVLARSPAANLMDLQAGLWSPAELAVDPREAVSALSRWLAEAKGVDFRYGHLVHRIEGTTVQTSHGDFQASEIIVASGSELQTLYPQLFAASGLTRCKLQMMRTKAQPPGWKLGPHVAGGLTLKHYPAFAICPSLPALRDRIEAELPELSRWGIHVLVSQNAMGEVMLGDSHEYGRDFDPFCRHEVEQLMLRELRRLIQLPDWSIADRWYGVYSKHPDNPFYLARPQSNVTIVTGLGGAGMTLSFGLAERVLDGELEVTD